MFSFLSICLALAVIFFGALLLRAQRREVERQDRRRDLGARRIPPVSRYRPR